MTARGHAPLPPTRRLRSSQQRRRLRRVRGVRDGHCLIDVRCEKSLTSRRRSHLPRGHARASTEHGSTLSVPTRDESGQHQRLDGGERGFSRSEGRWSEGAARRAGPSLTAPQCAEVHAFDAKGRRMVASQHPPSERREKPTSPPPPSRTNTRHRKASGKSAAHRVDSDPRDPPEPPFSEPAAFGPRPNPPATRVQSSRAWRVAHSRPHHLHATSSTRFLLVKSSCLLLSALH
jgi:hypothetical protein